ncbi:hypothetical protein C2E23DRAFT_847998 [Lenzites betulinus]|nr:hypothetical protein C2E23DRAFT_847998 [Lenzites betulinus]
MAWICGRRNLSAYQRRLDGVRLKCRSSSPMSEITLWSFVATGWLRQGRALQTFVCDPSSTTPVTLSEGHTWTQAPFVSTEGTSSYLPISYTASAAVDSVLSADDRSEASSSRGSGSISQGARAEMPNNIAHAVGIIVPAAESQGVFSSDVSVDFLRSICASHGISGDNVLELQHSLIMHVLSGAFMLRCCSVSATVYKQSTHLLAANTTTNPGTATNAITAQERRTIQHPSFRQCDAASCSAHVCITMQPTSSTLASASKHPLRPCT